MKSKSILTAVLAGSLFAASAAQAETVNTTKSFTLKSNSTETFRVALNGVGNGNALEPCYGFEIQGRGINYAAANLSPFGRVVPEKAGDPTVLPESEAILNADDERAGRECQADGWKFRYKALAEPAAQKGVVNATTASRRAKARKASAKPVQVLFAGLENPADGATILVKVRTGDLPGGKTKLTVHANALVQGAGR